MNMQSQGAGLSNLKFRKLENGYTVKYHVERMIAPNEQSPASANGFGGEIFCNSMEQVKDCVAMLIGKHLNP